MRYGVVSDIHANIQAWKAVLRDMKNQGVDIILCLGDVVGYGPNPAEVLDSCYEHVDYFILGNHDAVIGNRLDSSLFNDNAKYLIEWTRDQLNPAACDLFSDMPLRMEGEGFVCAHGELALPGRFGYIYEAQDAIESFTSNQSPMMFVGHTHFPAKFVLDMNNNSVRKDLPGDSFLLPNERYLINVGSVGDPRDGNTAASYCIYDTDVSMIKYRQVPFDIEKFRSNLLKAQLPVNPFFIRVYDGQQGETETIKDMKVMENNQTTEASPAAQRVIKVGDDVKKKRKQLTFSLDDVRHTRHFKAQEATRREAEAVQKKKGKVVVISLVVALLAVFGIVIAVFKSKQPDSTPGGDKIVNEVPDFIKEDVEVINQQDGKDLVLTLDKGKIPDDTKVDEASGMLTGWTAQTSKVEWTARIKSKGWYELFIEHAKKDSDAEVRLKMGFTNYDVMLQATAEGALEEKSLGYFETEDVGQMSISLIALKPGAESVTALKSVKLRFHGEQKPNPFGELDDVVFDDFSSAHFDKEWVIKGDAFPHRPLSKETISPHVPVKGVNGDYCAGSINSLYESKDEVIKAKGTMVSKKFIIKHRYIHMLARGGNGTSISLSIRGKDAVSVKAPDNWPPQLKPTSVNVIDFIGQEAQLVFRDFGDKNLIFDNIIFSNKEVADLPSSSNELKKPVPELIENTGNVQLAQAGKLFIQGKIDETVRALMSESGGKTTESGVDTSSYRTEKLKFSEMKAKSKKGLEQLDSSNVVVRGTNDKDTFTLKGKFSETHELSYIQLDAIADKGRSVGHAGNGNFFLSGINVEVTRSELMNKGRYVRVRLSGDKILSLAEVEVFSGDKNIAKGKNASQSSTSNDGEASRAVDGKTDGAYSNKSVTHTGGEKNPWWEVDLGETQAIDKIVVYNRTDSESGLKERLNRYSISILDENRKAIWHDFVQDAKDKNEHTISESFKINFDTAKATFFNSTHAPWKCIHSKDPKSGWSVHTKQGQSQTAWFGLNETLTLNQGDSYTVTLHFNSDHKKHVMKKFRVSALSEDSEKLAETEKKFSSFLNFKEAILSTFAEDRGKKVELTIKATGKKVTLPILGVKDEKVFFTRTKFFKFEALSDHDLEVRAKRLPDGELVWAHYNGGLEGKLKDLNYDKSTFIGKLVDAGSKPFVKVHNPLILSGRYIEIWKQETEKDPNFQIEVNSAGQKLIRAAEVKKFKDIYPDSPYDANFDVSVFDISTNRNINSFRILKKSDGKVKNYVITIKNAADEIVWQKGFYQSNLFDGGGKTFEIRGVSQVSKDLNLAKGAKVLKGTVFKNWEGLTDGIFGPISPFASAFEGAAPNEIVLDLGEEKTVNAFRAHKETTSAFNGIRVSYSLDNETFTDLGAISTPNNSSDIVLWTMPDQAVRYVKINFINDYGTFRHSHLKDKCILSEFEVLKF